MVFVIEINKNKKLKLRQIDTILYIQHRLISGLDIPIMG
jgi:hypothetical protein